MTHHQVLQGFPDTQKQKNQPTYIMEVPVGSWEVTVKFNFNSECTVFRPSLILNVTLLN
jgi:hypothetical protein